MKNLIAVLISITSSIGFSQTSFELAWTNPKYDTIIHSADSCLSSGDFLKAKFYYDSAFVVRPTFHAYNYRIISGSINLVSNDSIIDINRLRYYQLIVVADSLFYARNECEASKLYNEAKKYSTSSYSNEMLAKVHHPLHCEGTDKYYLKFVQVADEEFKKNRLVKAKECYERAAQLHPWDEYPKSQLQIIALKAKTDSTKYKKQN